MELMLFRVKVFRPAQSSIWDGAFSPSDELRRALKLKPTSRIRRGVAWHIGNITAINDAGLYLRIGKKSRRTLPMLDEKTGDFSEQELSNAPYTHVLVDWNLELVAIARNQHLSPTPSGIARRLQDVLNDSAVTESRPITFRVSAIKNPDEFIGILDSAFSIKSFSFSFTRKNLFDVQKDFVEPLERIVDEAHAADGKVTLKGEELASKPLREIAASAAATGDDASARVQLAPGAKTQTRSLHGDASTISVDDLDSDSNRTEALRKARSEYKRIRGSRGEAA
jgi:hypothetical protein